MTISLERLQFTWRLQAFRWWMIACFVSIPVSALLHRLIGSLLFSATERPYLLEAIGSYYSYSGGPLFISGIVLGICQWLVLRHYFRRASGWLVSSIVGSAIASTLYCVSAFGLHALANAYPWLYDVPVIGYLHCLPAALGLGLGLGCMQWLFFQYRFIQGANQWILAVLATQLAVELTRLFLIPNRDFFAAMLGQNAPRVLPSLLTGLLGLVLLGLIQGGLTGWVLASFIAKQKRASVAIL